MIEKETTASQENSEFAPALNGGSTDAQPETEEIVEEQAGTGSGLPDPAELYAQPKKRFPIWLLIVLAVLVVLGAGFGTLRLLETAALNQAAAGLESGDYVAAESAASRALALPLKALQGQPQRGYLLRGQANFHQGELDEALEDLLTASQTYPVDAALQSTLAQVYLAKGEPEKAFEAGAIAKAADDSLAFPYALDALKAYNEYHWDEALEAAEAALKRGDDSGLALRVRAALELWVEDFAAAGDDLDQAIEQAPDDVEILALRIYRLVMLDQNEAANAALEELLAISPDSAASLWAQGLVAYNEFHYNDALEFADQALALEERPEFYLLRAESYVLESPEAEKASLGDLDRALALQPDFFPAVADRTLDQLVKNELEDYEAAAQRLEQLAPEAISTLMFRCKYSLWNYYLDEASGYCDQAVERAPDLAGLHAYAGMVHTARYEFDDAWKEIETALALNPASPTALLAAYTTAVARQENEKAMEYLDQYLETHEDIAWVHANKAWLYNEDGESKLATSELEKAFQLDPYSSNAIDTRISFTVENGDNLTALNDANGMVQRYPKDPAAYISRGWVYLYDGNLDKARQDANTAISLSNRRPGAYILLATIYNLEGDSSAAILYANKALEVNPYQSGSYTLLTSAYYSMGEHEKSVENSKKAAEMDYWDDSLQLVLASAYHSNGQIDEARAVLEKLMEKKDDLDLTTLDQASTLLDFLESVAPAVDGMRTQVDSEHQFSITYPTTWIPQRPEASYSYDESLYWVITYEDIRDYADLMLYVYEIEDASQYSASVWAEAIESEWISSLESFQPLGRRTFRADGITGATLEYQYENVDSDYTSYTVRGKSYFFVKGDYLYLFEYDIDPYSYDTFIEEIDAIVATFSVLE